jgi:hypothetical protein
VRVAVTGLLLVLAAWDNAAGLFGLEVGEPELAATM